MKARKMYRGCLFYSACCRKLDSDILREILGPFLFPYFLPLKVGISSRFTYASYNYEDEGEDEDRRNGFWPARIAPRIHYIPETLATARLVIYSTPQLPLLHQPMLVNYVRKLSKYSLSLTRSLTLTHYHQLSLLLLPPRSRHQNRYLNQLLLSFSSSSRLNYYTRL